VADEFYSQFVEVLSRKNLFPPYGPECPRILFKHLRPTGMLFALQVRDGSGRILAAGLFPHDERSLYMWGAGSRMDAWHLAPNDFLQWRLMELAAQCGLTIYNMCGYGQFKSKYGGELQKPKRWHKAFSLTARWARSTYQAYFDTRTHVRGWWERVAHQSR
jgi:hypothetical protein